MKTSATIVLPLGAAGARLARSAGRARRAGAFFANDEAIREVGAFFASNETTRETDAFFASDDTPREAGAFFMSDEAALQGLRVRPESMKHRVQAA